MPQLLTQAASLQTSQSGRLQIGMLAGFKSEYPAGLNRNPHFDIGGIVRSMREALLGGQSVAASTAIGLPHLTPREREVLELLANGQTNKEMGSSLGISSRTVEVHRRKILEKLGARNTADAMEILFSGRP